MVIEFDEDVINSIDKQETRIELAHWLETHIHGRHLLLIPPEIARTLYEKYQSDFSFQQRRCLEEIAVSYQELRNLPRSISPTALISKAFLDKAWGQSFLLAENEHDAEVYYYLGRAKCSKNFRLNLDLRSGGGSSTPSNLKKIGARGYAPVICVVDSDRSHDTAEHGSVFKGCRAVEDAHQGVPLQVIATPVKYLENFVTAPLLEHIIDLKIRTDLDGRLIKLVRENRVKIRFRSLKQPIPNCLLTGKCSRQNNDSCTCDLISGLGASFSQDFAEVLNKVSIKKIGELMKDSENDWSEIANLVLAFGLASSLNSV